MTNKTNKTNGTNGRFWRYLIRPIGRVGRIGLISPILNATPIGYRFQYLWLQGGTLKKKLFLQLNLIEVVVWFCDCSCGSVNAPAKHIAQVDNRYWVEFFVNHQNLWFI